MPLLLLPTFFLNAGSKSHLHAGVYLAIHVFFKVPMCPRGNWTQAEDAVFRGQLDTDVIVDAGVVSHWLVPANQNIALIPGPLQVVGLEFFDLPLNKVEFGLGLHDIVESLLELPLAHYKNNIITKCSSSTWRRCLSSLRVSPTSHTLTLKGVHRSLSFRKINKRLPIRKFSIAN